LFLLSVLVLTTRIAFRSQYLYDIDSVNFALGIRRFDPLVHQPHPPGYFLYVLLGRAANLMFHDANTALVAISIAAGCGALYTIYALAYNWFGRSAAAFAGLIFAFSPLAWFHGTVALTYGVEQFFSGLAGYFLWRIYGGAQKFIVPAALTVGLAAGFRPSFLLFLGPLMLFSIAFARGRLSYVRLLGGAAVLGLMLAAWFLPMVSASGGFHAYWSSLISLWHIAPAKQTVFNSNPAVSLARLISIAAIYLLSFGCAALAAFPMRRKEAAIAPWTKVFIWMWVAPGLLFFTLIFLLFVNSGYLLVISPPVFAWLGLRASQWYAGARMGEAVKVTLVVALAAGNCLVFLFAPVYCSYVSVRHFETELGDVVRLIPEVASPADTMIVGFDSHFLGYRHAGYYLPGWFTAQYPEVRLAAGPRVFVMEGGDTQLAVRLPLSRFRNFIIFPLPGGDPQYGEYMSRIRARFPKGALRTVTAGGREFLLGPVTDLPLLFPTAAKRVYPTVYPRDHDQGDAVAAR
jgi:Protein O-mannosyl-transferase TMEM260-like